MKKIFLTEADRKKIISDKEKAIVESFAKTFNKIKRIDENELNEYNSLDDDGALINTLIEKLKETPEGNNVIKNLGVETIGRLSDNMYANGNRHVEVQAKLLIKRYGQDDYENSDQKLERYQNSEYYLNGERVYPEINYYNHYIGAVLDDRFYKIRDIEGQNGKYSLEQPKGKTGIYTENSDEESDEIENKETIYIDNDLSDYFDVPYQNEGEETIINSGALKNRNNRRSWDSKHLAIFDKYTGKDLLLKGKGYGWWEIVNAR